MRTTHIIICPGCQTEIDVTKWVRDQTKDVIAIDDDKMAVYLASCCPKCYYTILSYTKGMVIEGGIIDNDNNELFVYPSKDNY